MTERPRKITARLASSSAQCPLCRCDLAEEAIATQACEACGVRYHEACTRELGGCSTAGCARQGQVPADEAGARARERRRAALAADHELLLGRFRAGRDALRRDRWWTNVGMPLRAVALGLFLLAMWQLHLSEAAGQGWRLGLAAGVMVLCGLLLHVAGRLDRH